LSASTIRAEKWGRLVYDRSVDEFVAEVCAPNSTIRVDRPFSVGCLVTSACNLRCAFCYGNDESLPKANMDSAEWKQIFERICSWGTMRVDLSGGEPTVRKDLYEIARAAVDTGLNVVISTNGLLLTDEAVRRFPPVRWHVSLDSGLPEIHQMSRLLRSLQPSRDSFNKVSRFIERRCAGGNRVRVLTGLGAHNYEGLFALGEHIVSLGVTEWNISRILYAGRAQTTSWERWDFYEPRVLEQVHDLRRAYPFLRIRYSNRTRQDGYFLLVLPDGSLATQYTNARDKVVLGRTLDMSLADLQNHQDFALTEHARKWIAVTSGCQQLGCTLHTHQTPSTDSGYPCL
jgi:MoaA/NifB/PqqE/SkfB family radical SAM enzyme